MTSPTIKSIELINFMCHKHLLLKFDKMITCIGGRNGSGKSSIMIAIGLLFGRRAQSLERGSSYKSLIKSGCSMSIIRVELSNTRHFKNDFFGDTIIIERRLRQDNMSLSILNKHHRLFSSKKDDLDYLMEVFEIQFDNPLNFLTQEQSKKFLNVMNSENLYSFFVKGTELENISVQYEIAFRELDKMDEKLETVENEIIEIDKMLKERNQKLECHENIENNKVKVKHLEFEKQFSDLKIKLEEVEDLQKKVVGLETEIAEQSREGEEIQTKISKLELQVKKNKIEQERLKLANDEKIERNKNSIRGLDLQKVEIENEIKILNGEIQTKTREIENRGKYKNDFKENLDEEIKNLTHKIDQLEEDLKSNLDKQERLVQEAESEKNEINSIENRRMQLKTNINFYTKMRNNQKSFFGENLDSLINEISRTKFSDEVIGPIGLEIKLKNPKWYKAASIILRNVLSQFIVFNRDDRSKLNQIFRRYRVNFSIILPSTKSRELTFFKRNPNFTTLLDVLDIKNNIIINQLIILLSIEQIILIENRQNGYKIIRSRPENVDSCYTLDGDRIKLVNHSLSEFRPKVDKFYFEGVDVDKLVKELEMLPSVKPVKQELLNKNYQEIDFLKSKIEIENKRLNDLRTELANIPEINYNNDNLKEEIEMLSRQKQEIEGRLLEINNEILRYEKENYELSQFTTKFISKDSEIMDLKSREQFIKVNIRLLENKKTLKSKMLSEVAASYDKEKSNLISKYEDFLNSEDQNSDDKNYNDKNSECEKSSDHESVNQNSENDKKRIKKDENNFKNKLGNKKSQKTTLSSQKLQSQKLPSQKLPSQKLPSQKIISLSQKTFFDIENPREKNVIDDEIRILKAQIELSKELEKKEDIQKSLVFLNKSKKKKEKILNNFKSKVKRIKKSIEKCLTKKEFLNKKIVDEATKKFESMVSSRGYSGNLFFDHENKKLDLKMMVNKNAAGSTYTLSGGERSFAGICFLLSLWDFLSCPVKILDEFDVFMDTLNRSLTINFIFNFFKKQKKQIILITPLSMKEVFTEFCDVIVLEHNNE
ncbi:Structural maintenance of chromosomes protein 6 [Dictyocoela muelleri]|nr:Structural maintenance of chromosomes protein 6 [Dictyocoela muelleri]